VERVEENEQQDEVGDTDAGGEAACLAPLLCPECGVVLDGGPHRAGCTEASSD
jgi:hypothetical protein